MKINVNGLDKTTPLTELSYEELVFLAKGPGAHKPLYTVTYSKADQPFKPGGIVAPGESVKIKDGTIINVHDTSNA